MYFQLEVDYYSDEVNKSKYKNFQLKASTKSNLKIAEEQIVQGVVLAMATCHTMWLGTSKYFVAWAWCCLKVHFSSASYVCFSKI